LASSNRDKSVSSKADESAKRSKDLPVRSKDDMQQRLGLGLKNMYLNVLDEPLPDDILALLDQLDVDGEGEPDSARSDLDE